LGHARRQVGLHDNFKVAPFSIGDTFPLKPQSNERQVIFDYHVTLRVQVRCAERLLVHASRLPKTG
jgi:hypothetical protein